MFHDPRPGFFFIFSYFLKYFLKFINIVVVVVIIVVVIIIIIIMITVSVIIKTTHGGNVWTDGALAWNTDSQVQGPGLPGSSPAE